MFRLHTIRRAVLATGLTLFSAAADATLITGPFLSCPTPTVTVGTDGTTFFFSNGREHPVPGDLQPTADFSFSTPSTKLLQAIAATPDASCFGGTEVFLYEIPELSGQPLRAIQTPLCLADRLASQCHYSGLSTSSEPQISAFIQQRGTTTVDRQVVTWVDRRSGAVAETTLDHQVAGGAQLRWAQAGHAAWLQHDLPGPATSDWVLVDLCPATFGTVLRHFRDLGAGADAEVVQTAPGVFVARIDHPSLPNPVDVPLVDCLSTPPPPPDRTRLEVQFTGDGQGFVFDNSLISCDTSGNPNRCIADYPTDHVTNLSAIADPGSTFLGWSGDCVGTGTATVTLDQDKVCIAEFDSEFADLGVEVAADGDFVAGDLGSWTATVRNDGPETADATLSVTLPDGATFHGATSSPSCDAVGPSVGCPLNDLTAGSQMPLTVAVRMDADFRGSLPVTFSVSGTGFDANPTNDQRQLTTGVDARVDLTTSLRAVSPEARPGGLAVWSLDLENRGPSTALAPSLAVLLADGTHPLDDPQGTTVDCSPGRIPAGESLLLTFATRVLPDAAAGSSPLQSVDVTAAELDTDPGNDSTAAPVQIMSPAPIPTAGTLRRILATDTSALAQLLPPAVDGQLVAFEGRYTASLGGLFVAAGDAEPAPLLDVGRATPSGGLIEGVDAPSLDRGRVGVTAFFEDGSRRYLVSGDCGPTPTDADGGALGGSYRDGAAVYSDVEGVDLRILHWRAGLTTPIVGEGDPRPAGGVFGGLAETAAWDGTTAAFAGSEQPFPLLWDGLYLWSEGSGLRVAVDSSTPIPGRVDTFAGFRESLSIHAGELAFIGVDAAGDEGIYVYDVAAQTVTTVVDRTTPVPGADGSPVTLTAFSTNVPSIHGGRVAFVGSSSDGQNQGLYLADGGDVRLWVSPFDDLGDGFLAGGLRLGPQGFDGERIAFQTIGFTPPANFAHAIYVLELGRPQIFADGFESGDLSAWSAVVP